MPRLPQPGSDEGTWGDVLNTYLSVSHDSVGAIKTDAVPAGAIQDGSISDSKLDTSNSPSNGQVLGYSGGNLAWTNAGSPDPAMGGDLSGTASNAQIVVGAVGPTELATNAVTTLKIADSNVTDAKIASGVAQSKITNLTTDLAGKEPTITAGSTGQYWRGDKSWQTLDKTAVGLANVDNTSDANKPVSTATQTALNGKASTSTTITAGTGLTGGGDLSANRTISANFGVASGTIAQGNDSRITGAEQTTNKGAVNGYAGLNSSSRVPAAQLGSGTADSTTYLRGDGAWTAAPVTSVASKTGAVTLVKADVGLANVDNTSDLGKPVSTATQTALNGKADTTVTDGLNTRVTTLESAGIVALTDGATISTNAAAGKHFRVSIGGDRTLAAPTGAVDGMRRVWEVTASATNRNLTLATGTAGSFELTTNISSPITINSGKTQFIGAIYNSSRDRWTVLASQATL